MSTIRFTGDCLVIDIKQFANIPSQYKLTINYTSQNNTQVHNGTLATFSCNDNYYIYGPLYMECDNGTWTVPVQDFPVCLGMVLIRLSLKQNALVSAEQMPVYDKAFLKSVYDEYSSNDSLAIGSSISDMIGFIWGNLSATTRYSLGFGLGDNMLGCVYERRACDIKYVNESQKDEAY